MKAFIAVLVSVLSCTVALAYEPAAESPEQPNAVLAQRYRDLVNSRMRFESTPNRVAPLEEYVKVLCAMEAKLKKAEDRTTGKSNAIVAPDDFYDGGHPIIPIKSIPTRKVMRK